MTLTLCWVDADDSVDFTVRISFQFLMRLGFPQIRSWLTPFHISNSPSADSVRCNKPYPSNIRTTIRMLKFTVSALLAPDFIRRPLSQSINAHRIVPCLFRVQCETDECISNFCLCNVYDLPIRTVDENGRATLPANHVRIFSAVRWTGSCNIWITIRFERTERIH